MEGKYKAIAALKDYSLLRSLGQGAFGITYLAQKDGKKYAIKFPTNQQGAALLGGEALVMDRTEDYCNYYFACLVDVIFVDGDKAAGRPPAAIVSRYMEGKPLTAYTARKGGRLTTDQIKIITSQLLIALASLHKIGVAHRDVKPDNIIYDIKKNRATLIDFGLATTRPAFWAGSIPYLSPEVMSYGNEIIPLEVWKRDDMFGLGVTLYHLVNKNDPFYLNPSSVGSHDKFFYDTYFPCQSEYDEFNQFVDNLVLHPKIDGYLKDWTGKSLD